MPLEHCPKSRVKIGVLYVVAEPCGGRGGRFSDGVGREKTQIPEVARVKVVERVVGKGEFVLTCPVGVVSEHVVVYLRNRFVLNAVVSDRAVLNTFNHSQQHHGLCNLLDASASDASHTHSFYLRGESIEYNIVIDVRCDIV